MKTKSHSQKFLRKRKLLVVLPLLVLPFVTLLFWSLGGGSSSALQAQQETKKPGLNNALPDANLNDDRQLDKLSYYEKASSDSAKFEEQMKNDPSYVPIRNAEEGGRFINDNMPSTEYFQKPAYGRSRLNASPYSGNHHQDPNEAKVYKKLQQLDAALNTPSIQSEGKSGIQANARRNRSSSLNSSDIDRLEQMMAVNKLETGNEDPEMQQLNGVMDKILDIQHPERIKEKIRQTSEANKGKVFAVTANNNNDYNSLLTNNKNAPKGTSSLNRFYSLDDIVYENTDSENSIKAVVHQSQTLVDGSVVKLRLLTDVFINGSLVPKDHFVFGAASLYGERLIIKVQSIRNKNSLYPVNLSVCDMDGMEGIYIPGGITRDVAKQSAERAVQGIGFTSLDPSLKVQAASAGIEAAKSLVSKKAKVVKVTVKAGYQILLRDEKQE
jgi:conjugative transposon TraM protein